MKTQSPERLIIRDLYKASNGLLPITFYRRYRITPDILDDVLTDLENKGLAVYNDVRIKLTSAGRKWLLLKRKILIEPNKTWRNVPDEFKVRKLDVNAPYVPNIKLLDKGYGLFKLEN